MLEHFLFHAMSPTVYLHGKMDDNLLPFPSLSFLLLSLALQPFPEKYSTILRRKNSGLYRSCGNVIHARIALAAKGG